MNVLLLPIAFGAGIAIALQTTLNGQLARGIGGDSLAAPLISFIIAAALLCNVLLAPRIGLTLLVGLAVVGQLTSSLIIDHFALLGAPARPMPARYRAGSWPRYCAA